MSEVESYKKELEAVTAKIVKDAMNMDGIDACDVCAGMDQGTSVSVRLSDVESVEYHNEKSFAVTVYKGKKKGSASLTDISDKAIATALEAASRIADYTEEDEYAGLPEQERLANDVLDLDLYHPHEISTPEAIDWALKCEDAAMSYDKKISNSQGANFFKNEKLYVYGNSLGFLHGFCTTKFYGSCCVQAKDDNGSRRDYDFSVARKFNDLQKPENIGTYSAEKTIARLGARKIATCNAPVILVPETASVIWAALLSAISGSCLYKNATFLKDSLNTKIFPEFVTLTEKPHEIGGLGSAPFDAEGVATYSKDIIKSGVVESYILSTYTARRLGMQSTGNSGGVHNVYVSHSQQEFDELLQSMGQGLVVTDTIGRGTNIVTGDFSIGANGYWVEDGKIVYPVEEVTIAGKLQDMFASIQAIGSDIDTRSNILTGSIWLDKMTIAGN